MSVDLSLNPSETAANITEFIRMAVRKSGFSKVVVGLSGGIDSAVSCVLAQKALGSPDIYIGLFPYGDLNQEGLDDAKIVVSRLNIPYTNIQTIDIKPLVDPIFSLDTSIDDVRKGNIMARIRMILLYDLSKKFRALVLGTENKSEHLLGYFTRFGDEASDIEPIRHLYKTQVIQLAEYLKLPPKIIRKSPTAGLWKGQTDEGEFGFTYEEADQILHLYIDMKKSIDEIEITGFKKEIVKKVIDRLNQNSYKRKLPYLLR